MRINKSYFISIAVAWLFCVVQPAFAGDNDVEKFLPTPSCANGWNIDGKVTLYNKENLFDRINGEAELYFPYGFENLAYARYANTKNPEIAIDVDIYKMGSLIDAFGIYAGYRSKSDPDVRIGAEGTVSSSQLFFYQDRHFVRLQVTGATELSEDVFLSCAKSISQNLPNNLDRPKELDIFMIPALEQKSVRYIAQSLLGYSFFRRGITADINLKAGTAQVFLVPEESAEMAQKAVDLYIVYLKASSKRVDRKESAGVISVRAVDPLYGNAYLEQAGKFIIGIIRINDIAAAKKVVEILRNRIIDR
jgi:hypothetical protein